MDMKENKGGEKEGEKGPWQFTEHRQPRGHETLRGPIHRGSWQHIILYTPLPHRAMTLCSVKLYPKNGWLVKLGVPHHLKGVKFFGKI
jgi:hypothetical protein